MRNDNLYKRDLRKFILLTAFGGLIAIIGILIYIWQPKIGIVTIATGLVLAFYAIENYCDKWGFKK